MDESEKAQIVRQGREIHEQDLKIATLGEKFNQQVESTSTLRDIINLNHGETQNEFRVIRSDIQGLNNKLITIEAMTKGAEKKGVETHSTAHLIIAVVVALIAVVGFFASRVGAI